ncbi:hypothetical protein [uncultured Sphingomonas sp.]|uniref:hypothetical protein n=1 Tax=uncultured Sphingomonas sp. TaxID=158754 RepID=UPI003748043C
MALPLTDKHGIKAEICRRFGSLAAFERANGFPEKSVSDVLRGNTSARIERAIVEAISTPGRPKTENSANLATSRCGVSQ